MQIIFSNQIKQTKNIIPWREKFGFDTKPHKCQKVNKIPLIPKKEDLWKSKFQVFKNL